jgi:hypothetical protein
VLNFSFHISIRNDGTPMDMSLFTAAIGAVSAARELGKAALAVRDFNEVAPVIANLNDQLLKAQDALFQYSAHLLAMQQEQFETAEQLRKLKEALAQRGRYSLFAIADRTFVYRVNVTQERSEMEDPLGPEPLHYVCQPCFDKGVKSVLQKNRLYGSVFLECMVCDKRFYTGETEPFGV